MKNWRRLKKDDNAQALVEFTLILPILILLVLGMIEFGWLLNGKITLNSAAREGARAGVVLDATGADLKNQVMNTVTATTNLSGLTINSGGSSVTKVNDYIVVTVKAEIDPIIGLYVPNKVTMTSEAKMRCE